MSYIEFDRKAFDNLNLHFQGWLLDVDHKGVVCLLHGLGEHSGRYSQWAGLLNHAGYSLLTYDLRGHGKSEGKRGHVSSYDDYLKDTDILLQEASDRFPGAPWAYRRGAPRLP
jgi:alpha-beta hydrolase superfamily lysophospholipase